MFPTTLCAHLVFGIVPVINRVGPTAGSRMGSTQPNPLNLSCFEHFFIRLGLSDGLVTAMWRRARGHQLLALGGIVLRDGMVVV